MGAEYECETCGEMIDAKCPEAHDKTACLARAMSQRTGDVEALEQRLRKIERREAALADIMRTVLEVLAVATDSPSALKIKKRIELEWEGEL